MNEPQDLENTGLGLLTGGHYDVTFVMPDHPVFLSVGGGKKLGILMSPDGQGNIPDIPETTVFRPEHYGKFVPRPFSLDSDFDREFTMIWIRN